MRAVAGRAAHSQWGQHYGKLAPSPLEVGGGGEAVECVGLWL